MISTFPNLHYLCHHYHFSIKIVPLHPRPHRQHQNSSIASASTPITALQHQNSLIVSASTPITALQHQNSPIVSESTLITAIQHQNSPIVSACTPITALQHQNSPIVSASQSLESAEICCILPSKADVNSNKSDFQSFTPSHMNKLS